MRALMSSRLAFTWSIRAFKRHASTNIRVARPTPLPMTAQRIARFGASGRSVRSNRTGTIPPEPADPRSSLHTISKGTAPLNPKQTIPNTGFLTLVAPP